MSKWVHVMACACVVAGGCTPVPVPDGPPPDADTLHIFHNNRGAMCLEALAWLDTMQVQYPDLEVQEHLSDDSTERALLDQWKVHFDGSEGISTSFGFWPIIFYRGQAFSGFDGQVQQSLAALIASAHAPGP